VHEAGEAGLTPVPTLTAAVTSELAVSGAIQYLAIWRLLPVVGREDDPSAQHLRRAAPRPAYLFVPAFSMLRPVVQRLGVRLTEVQPALTLTSAAPTGSGSRPVLSEARPGGTLADPPGFQAVSPILIGRREAWGLAHFISMAIDAREGRDLCRPDPLPEPGEEDLLFLPAVWDPRYIHESNWRLLLREFDGLVA
jgi:hypothetical protein